MSIERTIKEMQNFVENAEPVGTAIKNSEWKFNPLKNSNKPLPDFYGKSVSRKGQIFNFEFLNMSYDKEYNELTANGEDIELNKKFKLKNEKARQTFGQMNNTGYKDNKILKDLRTYIKELTRQNTEDTCSTIHNLVDVEKVGIHSNDLIQALRQLFYEADLIKTYNGYVMPLKTNICKPIDTNELLKFIVEACNIKGISINTVKEALTYFNHEVEPEFNKITVKNGYYDFETGELYTESDEPIIIKKASPYNYREELIGVEPPTKLCKFLKETFKDDYNKKDELLEIFGYMLDDGNNYQIMPFFSGTGRNGKGVCLDLLSKLVNDNTSSIDIFSVDFGSKYSAPLIEADINIMNEIKTTKNLAEVKEYIGQGGLHLSRPFEQSKKYTDIELPKTILATNNFKGLNNNIDVALMKRLTVYIDFVNVVPKEKQNPFILREIVEEKDSMDWLLTNSLYKYQQIKNKGQQGKFQAEHTIEELSEHLERYINPILWALKQHYIYDNELWEQLTYNQNRNWDKFVSFDRIKEDLYDEHPEVNLMHLNKIKYCVIEAFDLLDVKNKYGDDYDGYYVIEQLYNRKVKTKFIRGLIRC